MSLHSVSIIELADKKVLRIELDLNEHGKQSKSGKSFVVASTRGNVQTDVSLPKLGRITVGVNAYCRGS